MNLQKKSAAGDPCSKERQKKIQNVPYFRKEKIFNNPDGNHEFVGAL